MTASIGSNCLPIEIVQGATFDLEISYKDSNGQPISMSGYVLSASLWNRLGTQKLATFSLPWTSQASGIFRIQLSASITSGITEHGQYDLFATDSLGTPICLMEGPASFNPSYTIRQ